jgi:hypothetical protein
MVNKFHRRESTHKQGLAQAATMSLWSIKSFSSKPFIAIKRLADHFTAQGFNQSALLDSIVCSEDKPVRSRFQAFQKQMNRGYKESPRALLFFY